VFACFTGLSIVYGLAFVGVAAEWFWARWFAIGLGNFGALTLLSLLQTGLEPTIAVFGASHLIISLFLGGEGMAARYEHSESTAERWNFQEESLVLLRRAVKSAGMSLPLLILYTLAPAPEALHMTPSPPASPASSASCAAAPGASPAWALAGLIALADGAASSAPHRQLPPAHPERLRHPVGLGVRAAGRQHARRPLSPSPARSQRSAPASPHEWTGWPARWSSRPSAPDLHGPPRLTRRSHRDRHVIGFTHPRADCFTRSGREGQGMLRRWLVSASRP
jgi:hypothetical protein